MHRCVATTRYHRAIVQLSMIVIAFVFGHDVMMAMVTGDHSSVSSHHTIAVEQCGPGDGLVHGQNALPFHPAEAAVLTSKTLGWAGTSDTLVPCDHSNLDASRLRAFLQVYLN